MKLIIKQNSIGNFSLFGDKSLEFTLAIIDENGKIIKNENNQARISYSTREDMEYEQEDNFDLYCNFAIEDLLSKCKNYYKSVISTRDYEGDFKFFIQTFLENKE